MTTLTAFIQYFEDYVAQSDKLQKVVFVTHYEEILNLQLSSKLYPALVIEMPEIALREMGSTELSFESAFTIISGLKRDKSPDYYFQKLSALLPLAQDLMEHLFCESERDEFDHELETRLVPVYRVTNDNAYGWRGYFTIKDY